MLADYGANGTNCLYTPRTGSVQLDATGNNGSKMVLRWVKFELLRARSH